MKHKTTGLAKNENEEASFVFMLLVIDTLGGIMIEMF